MLNIQYTSGTTGFPKGCLLTQRYWLTIGKVNAQRDGRTYRHILASTPFFYMDPQWQLMMSFYQHATLHVAYRQSASRFMHWVREHNIEFCLLPNVLLKQAPSPEERNHKLVKGNVYGFAKSDHAALEERYDLIAREAFGMTEIGSATFMPIEEIGMVGSGSCGLPSPFRECRVADPQGNALPDGEIGELIVRGPGILKGYYRKPEATAAAFHGEWFRTGDLFRRDARGFFTIVGRIKDMIRRAGENISALEVEAVVCSIDEVAEAAALPVADAVRGEEVKIYVVLQPHVPTRRLYRRSGLSIIAPRISPASRCRATSNSERSCRRLRPTRSPSMCCGRRRRTCGLAAGIARAALEIRFGLALLSNRQDRR